jgi:parallel beta-helix repeat protein
MPGRDGYAIVQALERRALLSTFLVSNTADAGDGSLRQAILDANGNAGPDVISFSIASGPQTIAPASALPKITDSLTIDGTTQPGYAGRPIIELSGAAVAGTNVVNGLVLKAPDMTVRGLVINRFSGSGVVGDTNSARCVFENNYIGTDVSGMLKRPNHIHGIVLSGNDNRVGGTDPGQRNVISGNGVVGVFFIFSRGNRVQGNYIGVGADGMTPVGNATGVDTQAGGDNLIGGADAGAANVISGNSYDGLLIFSSSDHNTVQGNLIGTDYTGTRPVGNGAWGVEVQGPNNLIGGTVPGARNVLSANVASGLVFYLNTSHDNVVAGNFIGTDITGTRALGNQNQGVSFSGDTDVDLTAPGPVNNVVGGASPEARNIIAASGGAGVGIYNRTAGNLIQGNFIGTDVSGTKALPNRSGVDLFDGSAHNTIADNVVSGNALAGFYVGSDYTTIAHNIIGLDAAAAAPVPNGQGIVTIGSSHNLIGGANAAADGNIIAGNRDTAVYIGSGGGAGNRITGNSIFDNGGLGIDLNGDGVTANTPGGPHFGPNMLQNFPVITSAITDGAAVGVSGTLNSIPGSAFTLDFYASPSPDPSGYGEGKLYLGSTQAGTDASGDATFSASFDAGIAPGQWLTATATAADGSTSEFSLARPIAAAPAPAVTAALFSFQTRPHCLLFTFTQNVSASIDLGDLSIRALPSGQDFSPTSWSYVPATRTVAFDLPDTLPDGDYRATLNASRVANAIGGSLVADVTLDFFELRGDANRDRTVDFQDLVILAQNYNTTGGMTWSTGDFTGDGAVDFADLVAVAQDYNVTLPALSPPSPAPVMMLRTPRSRSIKPVFSTIVIGAPSSRPALRPLRRRDAPHTRH